MSEDELKTEAAENGSTDEEAGADPLDLLRNELEEARQQVLYAQAETQNVRRRLMRLRLLRAIFCRSPITCPARWMLSRKPCAMMKP